MPPSVLEGNTSGGDVAAVVHARRDQWRHGTKMIKYLSCFAICIAHPKPIPPGRLSLFSICYSICYFLSSICHLLFAICYFLFYFPGLARASGGRQPTWLGGPCSTAVQVGSSPPTITHVLPVPCIDDIKSSNAASSSSLSTSAFPPSFSVRPSKRVQNRCSKWSHRPTTWILPSVLPLFPQRQVPFFFPLSLLFFSFVSQRRGRSRALLLRLEWLVPVGLSHPGQSMGGTLDALGQYLTKHVGPSQHEF